MSDRSRPAADRIAAVTVGPPQEINGPVGLAEYDPSWPASFRREAERIRGLLGGRAAVLEHAGSTSVPGLAAKPIVDIVLAVADSADEAAYVPDLEAGGYVLRIREPDWYEHRVFKGPDADVNVHVFTVGCPEIDRMLAFRDLLRRDDGARLAYEREKRRLAGRTWRYVQHYADAKTDIIEALLTGDGRPGPA